MFRTRPQSTTLVRGTYSSWRQMFMQRPKVRVDGYYYQEWWPFSRVNDRPYRSKTCTCYKYLCFNADGKCYMFTAEVRPTQALQYLHNTKHLDINVRCGQFFIDNNIVTICFKSSNSAKCKPNNGTYEMKLSLPNSATKPFEMLTLLPDLDSWEESSDYMVLDSFAPFLFYMKDRCNVRSKGPLL